MKRIWSLAAAVVCGATLSAFGASAEHHEYRAEKTQAKADYEAAKANCKTMHGDQRRDCMKEAKANYKNAKKAAKADSEAVEHSADRDHVRPQ